MAALVQNLKQNKLKTEIIVITDTTQERRMIIRAGADYGLLSFKYETQIGEILFQIRSANLPAVDPSATTASKESL